MTCLLRMLVAQIANSSSGRRVVDQLETATECSSAFADIDAKEIEWLLTAAEQPTNDCLPTSDSGWFQSVDICLLCVRSQRKDADVARYRLFGFILNAVSQPYIQMRYVEVSKYRSILSAMRT